MFPIPSMQENPDGFHGRYVITHADGSPTDPNAFYFVLRCDPDGADPAHTAACRNALWAYIHQARRSEHLEKLCDDLRKILEDIEANILPHQDGDVKLEKVFDDFDPATAEKTDWRTHVPSVLAGCWRQLTTGIRRATAYTAYAAAMGHTMRDAGFGTDTPKTYYGTATCPDCGRLIEAVGARCMWCANNAAANELQP